MMAGGGVRAAAVCAAAALAAAALAVPVAAERAVVQAPAALDFAAEGGVADDDSLSTRTSNRDLLNTLLSTDRLPPGSSLALAPGVNSSFHFLGGVVGDNLESVTLSIDGTLVFDADLDQWPTSPGSDAVLGCILLRNATGVTITSATEGGGVLDGRGDKWWGVPGVGYLERGENRPKLLELDSPREVLVERLLLKDSPYWTFWAHGADGLEVRHTRIDARRTSEQKHTTIDLTAFNTDGFDVTGRNVWIHDCEVWNQDDCVCVKDDSRDMLFERIRASGLGLTIGSIGGSTVRNITFRDVVMPDTYKGIYLKFRGAGLVEDVLFENVTIERPEQWALWMGPAQQSDSSDLCAAHPCSICWPEFAWLGAACDPPAGGLYRNITLRDVSILEPRKHSPGVLYGSSESPMEDILFDNVKVHRSEGTAVREAAQGGDLVRAYGGEDARALEVRASALAGENTLSHGWWDEPQYFCEGVASGRAVRGTSPVPSCFEGVSVLSTLSDMGELGASTHGAAAALR